MAVFVGSYLASCLLIRSYTLVKAFCIRTTSIFQNWCLLPPFFSLSPNPAMKALDQITIHLSTFNALLERPSFWTAMLSTPPPGGWASWSPGLGWSLFFYVRLIFSLLRTKLPHGYLRYISFCKSRPLLMKLFLYLNVNYPADTKSVFSYCICTPC